MEREVATAVLSVLVQDFAGELLDSVECRRAVRRAVKKLVPVAWDGECCRRCDPVHCVPCRLEFPELYLRFSDLLLPCRSSFRPYRPVRRFLLSSDRTDRFAGSSTYREDVES